MNDLLLPEHIEIVLIHNHPIDQNVRVTRMNPIID